MKEVYLKAGKLFISPMPFEEDLKKHGNFDIIWNLAKELEHIATYEMYYTNNLLLGNIADFNVPIDIKLFNYQLNLVIDNLQNNKKVLIHCLGGKGRTGLALSLVLMKLTKLSAQEALSKTKQICGGPETLEQISFVNNYEKM